MRCLLLLLLLLLLSGAGRALDVSLAHAVFRTEEQAYVELYLFVAGPSVSFTPARDSLLQAGVDVLLLFRQQGEIVQYDKFRLHSPLVNRPVHFLDLKRYALAPGQYELELVLADIADAKNTRKLHAVLELPEPRAGLAQSDIQLLAEAHSDTSGVDERFLKNGLYLEPLPPAYYGRGDNILAYYAEVYGAGQALQDAFVVTSRIERFENGQTETVRVSHQRQQPADVLPLLVRLDISDLPSGNYQLAVEVRDRQGELLSRRQTPFQRSNPELDRRRLEEILAGGNAEATFVGMLTPDTLEYSLYALTPLLPQADVEAVNTIIRTKNVEAQRMYLFRFWAGRNLADPGAAYRAFMLVARAVDQLFDSGFRHGFETDRGYVYLKYGRPNDIVRQETEPSAPPYEIWSYNHLPQTKQHNVRFIFYNPSLAAEDFVLLHSDVIGERQNPQWQLELYRNAPGDHPEDYFQGTDVRDNIGRRARQLVRDW